MKSLTHFILGSAFVFPVLYHYIFLFYISPKLLFCPPKINKTLLLSSFNMKVRDFVVTFSYICITGFGVRHTHIGLPVFQL